MVKLPRGDVDVGVDEAIDELTLEQTVLRGALRVRDVGQGAQVRVVRSSARVVAEKNYLFVVKLFLSPLPSLSFFLSYVISFW